jgi:hypothetical protein
MIKTSIVTAILLLSGEADATYVFGKCPSKIKGWKSQNPGKKLNLNRIRGLWGSIWENNIKMYSAECMSMKLEMVDRSDNQVLKMSTGVSWKYLDEVAYDDSMVLVFKDPTDSSKAAITTAEDTELKATHAD